MNSNILSSIWSYCTFRVKAKVCCIVLKVVINCITVLYEPYSTVMRLIGHILYSTVMPLISSYSKVMQIIDLWYFA